MPFNLIDTDPSLLVIDYEYKIINKDLLLEYVGEILMYQTYILIVLLIF